MIFLENEILYGQQFDVPEDPDFVLPIGKAKIERPGKDVTIVAFSIMVGKALHAAEELAKQGIDGRGDQTSGACARSTPRQSSIR